MSVVELTVKDRVAEIMLDRPPLNVIDVETARELVAAVAAVSANDGIAALVLRARGKAFCAGVDVEAHLPGRGEEMLRAFHESCLVLLELDVPVVAAVHGAALGGGCELAMCADIVLAADTAKFGVPEILLGVFPPVAAVALPRQVGPRVAAEMLLTGRPIDAAEAVRVGLVNRAVPAAELDRATEVAMSAFVRLSPAALRVAKRALRLSRMQPTRAEVDAAEKLYLDERLNAPDAIEGLQAFIGKRSPAWARG